MFPSEEDGKIMWIQTNQHLHLNTHQGTIERHLHTPKTLSLVGGGGQVRSDQYHLLVPSYSWISFIILWKGVGSSPLEQYHQIPTPSTALTSPSPSGLLSLPFKLTPSPNSPELLPSTAPQPLSPASLRTFTIPVLGTKNSHSLSLPAVSEQPTPIFPFCGGLNKDGFHKPHIPEALQGTPNLESLPGDQDVKVSDTAPVPVCMPHARHHDDNGLHLFL